MKMNAHPIEKTGLLRIRGGIHSEEQALALKATLEDLPGVRGAQTTGDGVYLRFDPELASPPQFYHAVELAGSRGRDFAVLQNN